MLVSCFGSQSDEEKLEVAVEESSNDAAAGQEAYADDQIALAGGDNELSEATDVGVNPGGNEQVAENAAEGETLNEGNVAAANAADDNIASIADTSEGNVLAEAGANPELTANQSDAAMESVINNNNMETNSQFPAGDDVPVASNEITNTAGDVPAGDGMGGADAAPVTMTEGSSLPEMGAKLTYVVKKGDTLGDIAQKIYGDKSKWRDLARWSGFSNPHLIFPGNLVHYQYTEQSAAFAAKYENQPKAEVVVQAGDSLSAIAQRVYGHTSHWVLIWRYNGHVANPDHIEVGQIIAYPQSGYLSVEQDAGGETQAVETVAQPETADQATSQEEVTQMTKQATPSNVVAEREAA